MAFFPLAFSGGSPQSSGQNQAPDEVDHLIYGVPDLEDGMRKIEGLLGVKPVHGGRHPRFGTHNALLSLGETTYLEIIAPDPDLPVPDQGRLFDIDQLERSRLVTWVLRRESIEKTAEKAVSQGLDLGDVREGSREKPDGTVLTWRTTDPYALPLDGAVPFLISWGSTPHPAHAAPDGGELVDLKIIHPAPAAVREALQILGVQVRVENGANMELAARIKTEAGEVEFM